MLNYSETEDDIFDKISLPYIYYDQETQGGKLFLAKYVMQESNDALLLPSCHLFSYAAAVAGLTENQIEFIACSAPVEYKKELLKSFLDENKIKEMVEIAKIMDDDLGQNIHKNQERIKRIYKYIKDNSIAFSDK